MILKAYIIYFLMMLDMTDFLESSYWSAIIPTKSSNFSFSSSLYSSPRCEIFLRVELPLAGANKIPPMAPIAIPANTPKVILIVFMIFFLCSTKIKETKSTYLHSYRNFL